MDIQNLKENCNLVPLLREQGLLRTLQKVGPYSKWLTLEFYTNLTYNSINPNNEYFNKAFVCDSWYDFSPNIINNFFNTSAHEDDFEANMDLIAKELIHAHYSSWPEGDFESRFLTLVYSVLLHIDVCN